MTSESVGVVVAAHEGPLLSFERGQVGRQSVARLDVVVVAMDGSLQSVGMFASKNRDWQVDLFEDEDAYLDWQRFWRHFRLEVSCVHQVDEVDEEVAMQTFTVEVVE